MNFASMFANEDEITTTELITWFSNVWKWTSITNKYFISTLSLVYALDNLQQLHLWFRVRTIEYAYSLSTFQRSRNELLMCISTESSWTKIKGSMKIKIRIDEFFASGKNPSVFGSFTSASYIKYYGHIAQCTPFYWKE